MAGAPCQLVWLSLCSPARLRWGPDRTDVPPSAIYTDFARRQMMSGPFANEFVDQAGAPESLHDRFAAIHGKVVAVALIQASAVLSDTMPRSPVVEACRDFWQLTRYSDWPLVEFRVLRAQILDRRVEVRPATTISIAKAIVYNMTAPSFDNIVEAAWDGPHDFREVIRAFTAEAGLNISDLADASGRHRVVVSLLVPMCLCCAARQWTSFLLPVPSGRVGGGTGLALLRPTLAPLRQSYEDWRRHRWKMPEMQVWQRPARVTTC